MAEENWWTRIKDFTFRNSPERLQGRLDDRAAVYSVAKERSRDDGPAATMENEWKRFRSPLREARLQATLEFKERPPTGRAIAADSLGVAAEARRDGDLMGARRYVEQARLQRTAPPRQPDLGLSR